MPADPEDYPPSSQSPWPFLLGFLGVAGAFSLLPKSMRRGFRRLVFGVFLEIATVVLAGLLAERMVRHLGPENDEEYLPEPPRRR